jgi:hypothetical protein
MTNKVFPTTFMMLPTPPRLRMVSDSVATIGLESVSAFAGFASSAIIFFFFCIVLV